MKILVTGSEGSLMQAVIPLLLEQGHEVRGIDNFARYGDIERNRDYEFIRGDLTDAAFAAEITAGVDSVIQAAALIYGVGGFHRFPADILSKDIVLHQNVLWGMLKNKVEKIVYVSSSMVYERCQTHPSKEEDIADSLVPSTDYGLSKLVGERLVEAFALQYGLKYLVWRPFNIITPHEKGESELGTSHVFADFIKNIVIEKKTVLPIIGDGEQIRCFTWIGDVARGIAEHSFSDGVLNTAFNLGNPEPITMKHLANIIYDGAVERGLIERSESGLQFESKMSFSDDVLVRIPDVSKAKEILGWESTLNAAQSVGRCLDLMVTGEHESAAGR
ncbi:MAG: NAD(P)-dependent oxidoreductase [Pyrinomonadaceae bacterium]